MKPVNRIDSLNLPRYLKSIEVVNTHTLKQDKTWNLKMLTGDCWNFCKKQSTRGTAPQFYNISAQNRASKRSRSAPLSTISGL